MAQIAETFSRSLDSSLQPAQLMPRGSLVSLILLASEAGSFCPDIHAPLEGPRDAMKSTNLFNWVKTLQLAMPHWWWTAE